jgi:hypothetical protein
VLIDTTVQVDGKDAPITMHAGESTAEVAKAFSIANKLDQSGMQKVYFFLNRKAVMVSFPPHRFRHGFTSRKAQFPSAA